MVFLVVATSAEMAFDSRTVLFFSPTHSRLGTHPLLGLTQFSPSRVVLRICQDPRKGGVQSYVSREGRGLPMYICMYEA